MDIRLDGKTALITGGSEGLGLAMAHKFSQSGANVALLARDASKLESEAHNLKGASLVIGAPRLVRRDRARRGNEYHPD